MSVVQDNKELARKFLRERFGIHKGDEKTRQITKPKGELTDVEFWEYLNLDECDVDEDNPSILIEWRGLLGFEFQSIGPMSFYNTLSFWDLGGDFLYVKLSMDDLGTWFVAALPKRFQESLLPDFLKIFYQTNGSEYWTDGIFGTLPSTTEVFHPSISEELMRECYRLFLDNHGDQYMWNPWKTEMESCQATLKRPNPKDLALHALKEMVENTKEGSESYFSGKDAASQEFEEQALNDSLKDSILDLLITARTRFGV